MARRSGERPSGRGRGRGSTRRTIALVLLGFVLIGIGVIYRRTVGLGMSRQILALEQARAADEAKRVELEGEIRAASSRAHLIPIAQQRLHMHLPTPDQLISLPRAPRIPPFADSTARSRSGPPRRP